MQTGSDFDNFSFDLPKNQSNVIKVIGVGGGGSNALNYMYQQGINGVDFVVCNTDAQALQNSPVPNKIQLGLHLTEGLGAGANPEIGAQSAMESGEALQRMLEVNTKMVFITAGMGGGTGTGAAPVIAKMAQEMGILTVGIVTIPFQFEGKMRTDQAQKGVEKLRKHVDSLIVINNNKLREVYGNLGFKQGFSKADEVLATASRGIAEVITHHYTQNIDLRDARTVLANSGTAIMGSATASGSNRAVEAISKALDSPLLNDNKISGAKNVLLLIVSGVEEITLDEIGAINEHIQNEAGNSANIIMGVGEDSELDNAVSVTVIATGFDASQQQEIVHADPQKIIHSLEDEQTVTQDLLDGNTINLDLFDHHAEEELENHPLVSQNEESQVFAPQEQDEFIKTTQEIRDIVVDFQEVTAAEMPQTEHEFVINDLTAEALDIDVVDAEWVKPETQEVSEQFNLLFDFPTSEVPSANEEKIVYQLKEDVDLNNIEVHDSIEIIPIDETDGSGVKRYSLDDYDESPMSTPKMLSNTETKVVAKTVVKEDETEATPLNSPISELSKRTAERRITLKEFNHKFYKNTRIEDLERVPAFKRAGVELGENPDGSKLSRTTIEEDSNEGMQMRSNNSFLHDNVD